MKAVDVETVDKINYARLWTLAYVDAGVVVVEVVVVGAVEEEIEVAVVVVGVDKG